MSDTTVYVEADSGSTIIVGAESSTVILGNTTIVIDADPDVVIVESAAPVSPVFIVAPDQLNITIGDNPVTVTLANPAQTIIESNIGPPGPQGPAGIGEADDVSYQGAYPNVQAALDALLYVAPHINSFTDSVGTVELGTTVTAVTLAWTLNKSMTSLALDHGPGSVLGLTSKPLTGLTLTTETTYTLTAGDGQNTTSAQTTVAFRNKRYWGVSASESLDNAGILELTSEFATNYDKAVTYDATGGKYLYYAFPASFGTPSHVTVGGLPFSDFTVSTLEFTNVSGHTESFNVIRLNNRQTGAAINVNWT